MGSTYWAWVVIAILCLVAGVLLFYRFYFLRKPIRTIPHSDSVVSPADGTIARIIEFGGKGKETVGKGLLGKVKVLTKDVAKRGYMIVIVMTPFNVHYQRSPVRGVVESTKHSKGKFVNVVKDAASLRSLENEKNEIVINGDRVGKVKVVQVAGFLARRIRCFVNKNQKIHKGEDIGLICLGSQVILVIPKMDLKVKEGQRVVDGETVIARF